MPPKLKAKSPAVSSNPNPLRPSNVPWMELEESIRASTALQYLLCSEVERAGDKDVGGSRLVDETTIAGLFDLHDMASRRLAAAFDSCHRIHDLERKL